MTPNRPGARGCPGTTLPVRGALQAVLVRFFSRRRTAMCPEARTPDPVGMAGLSLIGDA